MTIKDDGYRVYLDYGNAITYEWEECYFEGYITKQQYDECTERQEQLDNKPF